MKKAIILMIVLLAFTFAATVSASNQVTSADANCQILSASPLAGPEDPPPPPPEDKEHHKHKPKNPPPDNQPSNNQPPDNQAPDNPPPEQ